MVGHSRRVKVWSSLILLSISSLSPTNVMATLLVDAVRNDNLKALENTISAYKELQSPDPDIQRNREKEFITEINEALVVASGEGNTRAVTALLSHGADVNYESQSERISPLFSAAQRGHIDTVQLLLQRNANPDQKTGSIKRKDALLEDEHNSDQDMTPLFIATKLGHSQVVDHLLQAGADPNEKWQEQTPLISALLYDNTAIAEALVKSSKLVIGQERAAVSNLNKSEALKNQIVAKIDELYKKNKVSPINPGMIARALGFFTGQQTLPFRPEEISNISSSIRSRQNSINSDERDTDEGVPAN